MKTVFAVLMIALLVVGGLAGVAASSPERGSTATRMYGLSGEKEIGLGETWVALNEDYSEVRHVSLTINYGPLTHWPLDSVTLYYRVGGAYWANDFEKVEDQLTLDFNTTSWRLSAQRSYYGTIPLHLSYAATVTYS